MGGGAANVAQLPLPGLLDIGELGPLLCIGTHVDGARAGDDGDGGRAQVERLLPVFQAVISAVMEAASEPTNRLWGSLKRASTSEI